MHNSRACGAPSAFQGGVGYRNAYSYKYEPRKTQYVKRNKFNIGSFAKDVLIRAVMGALSSALFYGAGKGVEKLAGSLKRSIKGGSSYVESPTNTLPDNTKLPLDMKLQFFAKKSDIKQNEHSAKKFKMTANQRRSFGDYIESLKKHKRNDANFSWNELMQIAENLGNCETSSQS